MARSLKRSRLPPQRSDPSIILTASEIGSFAFCPAAWHNQRVGAARTASSMLNLEHGTLAHRRIATRAMRIRSLERVRVLVLLMVIALVAGLLAEVMSAWSLIWP
jgi:hypothetical protein